MKQLFIGFFTGVFVTMFYLRVMTQLAIPKLGMTVDQVSKSLGREIVLSQGGRLYPVGHAQTETEKEQDLRYYFEIRDDSTRSVFYGFNERKKLIQIIDTHTHKLYSPLPFDPALKE